MPDLPGLRLVRVGSRGFNINAVTWWGPNPEGGVAVGFAGDPEPMEFEGIEAKAVARYLENRSEPIAVDHPTGQRAEPVAAHAATDGPVLEYDDLDEQD